MFIFNRNSDDVLIKLRSATDWAESASPNTFSGMSSLLSCLSHLQADSALGGSQLRFSTQKKRSPVQTEAKAGAFWAASAPRGGVFGAAVTPRTLIIHTCCFHFVWALNLTVLIQTSELYGWTASLKKRKKAGFHHDTHARTHTLWHGHAPGLLYLGAITSAMLLSSWCIMFHVNHD